MTAKSRRRGELLLLCSLSLSSLSLGLFGLCLFSLLGSSGASCASCLSSCGLFLNQSDQRDRGVVALAVTQLDDAGVAAVAISELRTDLVEQLLNCVVVVEQLGNVAAICESAALCLGNQLLNVRTQQLGLGVGGLNLAVLDELLREVGQNLLLVRSGAAETGTLLRGRHR